MKNSKNVIGILVIAFILSLGITAETFVFDTGSVPKVKGTVTKVTSPEQSQVMTPKWAESTTFTPADLGTNLAAGKAVTANAFEDVYVEANVTDGKTETYWEGKSNNYPNILTVDLGTSTKIGNIRLKLVPDKVWGKRVQAFTVLGSSDGTTFNEVVPAADYQFDPKTGNQVIVKLPAPADMRYVRLQFTKNTGANGGQISEFEIYASK